MTRFVRDCFKLGVQSPAKYLSPVVSTCVYLCILPPSTNRLHGKHWFVVFGNLVILSHGHYIATDIPILANTVKLTTCILAKHFPCWCDRSHGVSHDPGFATVLNYIMNYYSGADTEVRDPRGFTALIKAGLQGREDCVAALLMHGKS